LCIAISGQDIKENKNIRFWLGEFFEVLPSENKIKLSNGELTYDYLVFATGTESNYFGMENVKKKILLLSTGDVNGAYEAIYRVATILINDGHDVKLVVKEKTRFDC
jgi:NADH dehydrogenase FAD-containing subunit